MNTSDAGCFQHPFQLSDVAKPDFLFPTLRMVIFPEKDKGTLITYTVNPHPVETSIIAFTSLSYYLPNK